MRFVLLLLAAVLAGARTEPPTANVNSRYVVEGVEFPAGKENRLSEDLRDDVTGLVGKNYDPAATEELAARMRRELRAGSVTHRLSKGQTPEHVVLHFEASGRRIEQQAEISKLAYHSTQGWTGDLRFETDHRKLRFGAGVRSDSDRLLERAAGFNLNVSRIIGNDRARIRLEHDRLHQIWNRTTRLASGTNPETTDVYRFRWALRPMVSIVIVPGLIYTAGVEIQHIEFQPERPLPELPAARTEAANCVLNTLRLRRSWGPTDSLRNTVEAGYSLRAATRTLDSDFVYARHLADGRYTADLGDNHVTLRAGIGTMSGRAPLYERFSVGDTERVRGWNKFDIDPLGGSRTAWGSFEYRYDHFLVFYDVGSVWDHNEARVARHGIGAGFGAAGWFLAVAFPLRSHGVQPVFMLGTTF
jgi:hypothetical protein